MCVCVKVGSEVSKHLADAGVEVKPYTALLADIKTLAAANTKLWTDPAKVMHPCLLHNPFPVSPPHPPPPPPPPQINLSPISIMVGGIIFYLRS